MGNETVEVLTGAGAARRAGLAASTWRKYQQWAREADAAGRPPNVPLPDALIDGEPKGWLPETIDAYRDRPRRPGARMDTEAGRARADAAEVA